MTFCEGDGFPPLVDTPEPVLNFECHCGAWCTGEPIVLVERWAEPKPSAVNIVNGVAFWDNTVAYHVRDVMRFFGSEECQEKYLRKRNGFGHDQRPSA